MTTENCAKCGRPIPKGQVIWQDNLPICEKCLNQNGTCLTCTNRYICLFETDPSPTAKVVRRTINQGPMTMQVEERNPMRIAKTCAKGCKCYNTEDKSCFQQDGTCGNYNYETISS